MNSQTRCWTPIGRKEQPKVLSALDELLQDATAGDPVTGLKWTRETACTLSRALQRQGYEVGEDTYRSTLAEKTSLCSKN